MYLEHFGLTRQAFSMTPDPSFFFDGNKRGEILDALIYAVSHGDGIIKVTGEVGSGKTMLCRMLESRLPANVEVIYLINPTLTRDQVVFTIAGELGIPVAGLRADEVIRVLQTELINKHIAGNQVVLLIEEAQAMSLDTLEEIRLFTNLETAHHKLLQIVLFGQPELDDHLNVSRIRQLKERICNSFKVPPLTSATVSDYVSFRLRAAGYRGPQLFSKRAIRLLSAASQGVVRRIGILADKALLAAYADGSDGVEARHVKAAVRDSEMKLPWWNLWPRLLVSASGLALVLFVGTGWYVTAHGIEKNKTVSLKAAPTRIVIPPPLPNAATVTVAPTPKVETKALVPQASIVPIAPMAPVAPVAQVVNSTSLDAMLQDTKLWLNQQPVGQFTVQVALLYPKNSDVVDRYLRKLETQTDIEQVHVYDSARNASVGIVIGNFTKREEALQMVSELETKWGYKAQLRTVGGIRKEML